MNVRRKIHAQLEPSALTLQEATNVNVHLGSSWTLKPKDASVGRV